jgi:hypothetical protein
VSLVRNRICGWPAFSPWRSVSSTKFGEPELPNSALKNSTQLSPQDGVAALALPAVSAPIAPAPPTRVSVAVAAKTLLLMDIESSSLKRQPYPAHGWQPYRRRLPAR